MGAVYAHSTPERTIIQFNGFGDTTDVAGKCATAQVVLYPDGKISYRYLHFAEEFPTEECGVAIESQDGTDGLGVVFYANPAQDDPLYLHDNLQIDFYPPLPWMSLDHTAGSIPPVGSEPLEVDFESAGLTPGDYTAVMRMVSNDPDTMLNPLYVPTTLTINDESVCYCPLGDIDLNTQINPIDVVLLVVHVYKGQPVSPYHPQCPYNQGDIQADGEVNPQDVVLLVDYVYKNADPPVDPCE